MKTWKEQIDPSVHLEIAAGRFSIEPGSITKLGGFENVVYTGRINGREVILRVSHTDHRSIDVAESELHWVQDLAARGVPVSRPLASVSGKLLEAIPTHRGQLLLSLWEKAPGRHVNPCDSAWGPDLFRHWGEVTGMLHASVQDYRLPAGMTPRPDMTGINILPSEVGPLNPVKESLLEKYEEVTKQTRNLPRTRSNFGLSHRDLHGWNFFIDSGRITVFDFDDCGYDYFAHDIAMAVYYATDFMHRTVPASSVDEVSARAQQFLEEFLKGYRHYYDLGVEDLLTIPLFAERRRIELTLLTYDPWSNEHAQPEGGARMSVSHHRVGTQLYAVLAMLALALAALLPAVAMPAAAQIVLRVATWDGPEGQIPIRDVIAEFEAENPGVQVQLEQVDDYKARVIVQIAGGVGPDMFMVGDWDYAEFAQAGLAANLTPYLARDGVDLGMYIPQLLENHRYVDGQIYTLPKDFSTLGICYNMDLFDQAGLAYPQSGWTWDEALEMMRKLTRRRSDDEVESWGVVVNPWWNAISWAQAWGRGQTVISPDYRTARGYLDHPDTTSALQFFYDLGLSSTGSTLRMPCATRRAASEVSLSAAKPRS